ncbi:MAG: NUDIX hydrolase [Clostridiales Family XIII bacterium]|jgi:ADP-ribose pyrophosphatase YjhB (NUDIX family)|nr:NUDIX hydrolase [Clostridiales Family XIII bacterium]
MWTGGVRVIISDGEGRILLVKQCHEDRDIWMAPGGAIEAGENSQQAAAREVLEETGLRIRVGRLLWHIEEVSPARGQRFVNYFLAEPSGGAATLGTDPELGPAQVLRDLAWLTRAQVAALPHVYPDALREEVWNLLEGNAEQPDAYRIRT